jgi:hypothetical protein
MSTNNIKVKVVARPEPNLRKLARALIALAQQTADSDIAHPIEVKPEIRRSA